MGFGLTCMWILAYAVGFGSGIRIPPGEPILYVILVQESSTWVGYVPSVPYSVLLTTGATTSYSIHITRAIILANEMETNINMANG